MMPVKLAVWTILACVAVVNPGSTVSAEKIAAASARQAAAAPLEDPARETFTAEIRESSLTRQSRPGSL